MTEEQANQLLAEQRKTNALLEQLIQVTQAGMTINEMRAAQGLQPRTFTLEPARAGRTEGTR